MIHYIKWLATLLTFVGCIIISCNTGMIFYAYILMTLGAIIWLCIAFLQFKDRPLTAQYLGFIIININGLVNWYYG